MISVFEALKSEGLVYQDPGDPSGSTWLISEDADKVVEKVEKLVTHAWKTGRRYQLGEFMTNRRVKKLSGANPRDMFSHGKEIGYNQAVDVFEKLFEDEEEGIYE